MYIVYYILYVVCCLLFVVYRLKEKISLLDLDYSHRTMFKKPVHCGLFFSPLQDPVSSIIFWGTNRFPNWVVFAVGPLKVFDRMGDQAKIHISLNVSLQNTMGSHAPFFYHAHFRSNEAGIGITRGTVSLSEISAVIVWYHGTNLSGQHTMVSFQKTVENGQSLLLSLLL